MSSNSNCALFLVGQAALGAGLGMLVADKIDRNSRQTASIVAIAAGVLASVPMIVDTFNKRINAPDSTRGARRRLRSIREGSGFPSDAEVF